MSLQDSRFLGFRLRDVGLKVWGLGFGWAGGEVADCETPTIIGPANGGEGIRG